MKFFEFFFLLEVKFFKNNFLPRLKSLIGVLLQVEWLWHTKQQAFNSSPMKKPHEKCDASDDYTIASDLGYSKLGEELSLLFRGTIICRLLFRIICICLYFCSELFVFAVFCTVFSAQRYLYLPSLLFRIVSSSSSVAPAGLRGELRLWREGPPRTY